MIEGDYGLTYSIIIKHAVLTRWSVVPFNLKEYRWTKLPSFLFEVLTFVYILIYEIQKKLRI